MRRGELVRGAGQEVRLVDASDKWQSAMEALCEELWADSIAMQARTDAFQAEIDAANFTDATTEAFKAKEREARALNGELNGLRSDRRFRVDSLLNAYAAYTTSANADGHFRFEGVAPGQYRLWAAMETNYRVEHWLVPVKTSRGSVETVHLSQENFVYDICAEG